MPCRTSLRARSGVIVGVKPSLHQHVERVALQGQFQQHGVVLEEVEAVAGDAGPALEVDQVELLGQLDVVQRLEIELRQRRLAAEQFQVRLVVDADGRGGVREIGNRPQDRLRLGGDLVELSAECRAASSRMRRPSSFRASRCSGRGLADRPGRLVGLAIGLVDLRFAASRRWVSSSTNRSTSAVAPRLLQFCLTSSAFSTMNLRSSMEAGRCGGL